MIKAALSIDSRFEFSDIKPGEDTAGFINGIAANEEK